MPNRSTIREILEAVALAIAAEMVRILDSNGKRPLREGSALKKQLLSGEAVRVTQGRGKSGRFEGYTATSSLTIYALDYLQYLDSGRKPGGKKVPLFALVKFIKNRKLILRDKQSGRFAQSRVKLKSRTGGADVTINRLAFMIQNAIFRNGIKARPVIQPAFDYGQQLIDFYLNEELLDSLSYEIEEQLKFSFISTKK